MGLANKLRPPDAFPAVFHAMLRELASKVATYPGNYKHFIEGGSWYSPSGQANAHRKFSSFVRSIRHFNTGEFAELLQKKDLGIRRIIDHREGVFRLRLVCQPKLNLAAIKETLQWIDEGRPIP